MKRIILNDTVHVVMYLKPIIHQSSKIFSSVAFNKNRNEAHTDVNPSRIINGPLSNAGEEIEPPLKDEFDKFKDDCVFLINELGFEILSRYTSTDSKKSEYVIIYGMKDDPCGTLVFDIRISDHSLDNMSFPEELKPKIFELLKMNNVLSGDATLAGIDFCIEKVTVGSVVDDTWDRAFNRLFDVLNRVRNKIRVRNKVRK